MISAQPFDPHSPLEPVPLPRPIGVVIDGLLVRWRLSMLFDAYRVMNKPRLRPPRRC